MRPKFAALLCFAFFTAASLPAPSAERVADSTPDKVLIVGDSLSSAHRMEPSQGWVSLLQTRLATETGQPTAIVNASRGGKALGGALNGLPGLLATHHPDVVVLELGGNDAILGAKRDAIERDLSRLIDLSRAQGAKVAILGFVVPAAFDKNGSADLLRAAYANVARTQDVALLPSLLGEISTTPALLQDDGIHPNAAAQPRVLDNAWPTLRPLLLGEARTGATVRTSGASK